MIPNIQQIKLCACLCKHDDSQTILIRFDDAQALYGWMKLKSLEGWVILISKIE